MSCFMRRHGGIDDLTSPTKSLFFELRTAREEFHALRKQVAQNVQSDQQAAPATGPQTTPNLMHPAAPMDGNHADPSAQRATAQPWEFVDEITNALKTHAPLLHPTLETIAENVLSRFKPTPEEEIYRFILALLVEGLHVSCSPNFNVDFGTHTLSLSILSLVPECPTTTAPSLRHAYKM